MLKAAVRVYSQMKLAEKEHSRVVARMLYRKVVFYVFVLIICDY
jgi:hypothetical protein